ncbi:MAG TPA: hypothetical protein VGR78_06495 [Verrucomicrobiae bacterium]|nr:hypothetical protein [Verrucomicrobiae bacterium]
MREIALPAVLTETGRDRKQRKLDCRFCTPILLPNAQYKFTKKYNPTDENTTARIFARVHRFESTEAPGQPPA